MDDVIVKATLYIAGFVFLVYLTMEGSSKDGSFIWLLLMWILYLGMGVAGASPLIAKYLLYKKMKQDKEK